MNTSAVEDAGTIAPPAERLAEPSEPRWRAVARVLVAIAFSGLACTLIYLIAVPRALPSHSDIVGYPTVWNLNYLVPIFRYRMAVYAFPLFAIIGVIVLGWRGPLRRVRPSGPRDVARLDLPAPARMPVDHPLFRAGAFVRLLPPAGVVVAEAATRTGQLRGFAMACGALYLALVVVVAVAWRKWLRRDFWDGLALANGLGGAVAAVLGLWWVSRHTIVTVGTVRHQEAWLPQWLAAAGAVAILAWTALRLRKQWAPRSVEGGLLVVVVGAVAVFLAAAELPKPVVYLSGFDDAQDLAGSSLLARGEFPWRDFLFIHGLWPDALRANLAAALFGDSIWGIHAGYSMVLFPLSGVILYLFAAWLSRGNPWLLLGGALIVVGLGLYIPLDTRFILVPVALMVLGETLRRAGTPRARGWCVGLVLLLFVSAILMPETAFLAAPAVVVVAAADLVHRKPGTRLWPALELTRWCIGTGVVTALAFSLYLLANGALGALINYYLVFAPGHNESGAEPLYPMWGLPHVRNLWLSGIATVLITIWLTVWRLRSRRAWQPTDWVAVAGAVFVALFEEKALGRFDGNHIQQVFSASFPVTLLVVWILLSRLDALLRARRGAWSWSTTPVVSVVVAVGAVVCVVAYPGTYVSGARQVGTRQWMTAPAVSPIPHVGYTVPGYLDEPMLHDLDAAFRAYAGADQPVFDFTNSMGWVYYLLHRDPGSRFEHIDMAIPPYAQSILVDELKKSRPPVILFDTDHIGQPVWDYIGNSARHYMVAQYVLDNWVPVLRTHGNLLLVRKDLAERQPPLPALSEPPQTTGLEFTSAPCVWGTSPNYLHSQPRGGSLRLPVEPVGRRTIVTIEGRAADPGNGQPAKTVVILDGSTVAAAVKPDIVQVGQTSSGGLRWLDTRFRYDGFVGSDDRLSVFMEAEDGKLHPLPVKHLNGLMGAPAGLTSIKLPDGRVLPVDASPAGEIDGVNQVERTVGQVRLPSGARWTDYQLATLSAGAQPLGPGHLQLTDDPGFRHEISADVLPHFGHDLSIRVGSCLQWHGYAPDKPLYVIQDKGPAVTDLTLTGVKDPA